MAKILFLAHRVPFPPNKGDKIRAFHMLRHLAARHDVWLGACADAADDMRHLTVADERYRDTCIVPLRRSRRAFNMAEGAIAGEPLSVARFRHPRLKRWIDQVVRDVRPEVVFVYSSALAQYVLGGLPPETKLIADLVDCDAEKWRAYAQSAPAPLRWVYGAEFHRLARFDARVLAAASAAVVVSETERLLFERLIPAQASKLRVIANGVDTAYFHPAVARPGAANIVFCGSMDYRPNIDGALWFAREVLPRVRQAHPRAAFQIVGAQPAAAVVALRALPGVEVTGAVPDVRPYLACAAVVVAPLRIARGVQNKVLEGMAAGRPVVATPQALDGIGATAGRDVLVGRDASSFACAVGDVLSGRAPADIGVRARRYVVAHHQWTVQLAALDRLIAGIVGEPSGEAAA